MSRTPLATRVVRLAPACAQAGLLIAVAGALSLAAARRALWYDELFSYHIARLPHASAVLAALLSGADNGPPLDYLARHASMKLLGENNWSFRLPSILAVVCALACLGAIARRTMSRAAAATVLVLPLGTLAVHYAVEGRAYASLLACASLSLLAWQRAIESPRPVRWLVVLTAALAAGPLCHYYGVLNYLPVMVGEAIRSVHRRRASRPVLWSLGISLLTLLLVPPFARHALEMKQHFWAHQVSFETLLEAYRLLLGACGVPGLLLGGLAVAGWLATGRARHGAAGSRVTYDRAPWLSAAAVTLAFTPVFIWVSAALYTNAATARYAIAAVAGFALLAGEGLGVLERGGRVGRRAAWAVPLTVLALGLATVREEVAASGDVPVPAAVTQLVTLSPRPIAVDSPLLFLQTFHHLPPSAQDKLVYLVDRAASRRHLGFDNDDIALPNLARVAAVRTEPYAEFCAREQEFDVLALRNRYWLLAQLAEDGAHIVPVAQYDRVEVFRVYLR